MLVINGFYTIKNEFFELINDKYLMDNKDGKRPFYYCLSEEFNKKTIYWMIPLSSKVEKYKSIIEKRERNHLPTDGFYISTLPNGRESAFLIQDMFPITENFIEREYKINGRHVIFTRASEISEIDSKSRTVKKLLLKGIQLTPTSPNIKMIFNKISK